MLWQFGRAHSHQSHRPTHFDSHCHCYSYCQSHRCYRPNQHARSHRYFNSCSYPYFYLHPLGLAHTPG